MDRLLKKPLHLFKGYSIVPFTVCAASFFAGCIFGTAYSRFIGNEDVLFTVLSQANNISVMVDTDQTLISVLVRYTKYLAVVFLLGFSCLGVITVPLLSAFRGFSIAFSVAAFIRLYGNGGVGTAAAMFGAELIILLPCFMIAAANSLSSSRLLINVSAGRLYSGRIYSFKYFKTFFICLAIHILTAITSYFLMHQ